MLILGTELYGYNFTEVETSDIGGAAIFVGMQADLWDINLESWNVADLLLNSTWAPVASSYGAIGYHILFEIDVSNRPCEILVTATGILQQGGLGSSTTWCRVNTISVSRSTNLIKGLVEDTQHCLLQVFWGVITPYLNLGVNLLIITLLPPVSERPTAHQRSQHAEPMVSLTRYTVSRSALIPCALQWCRVGGILQLMRS